MFVEAKFFHKAGEGSGGGGGGGGSDPHNLGYYADLTALQTAHPTGTNGDFAILGSTDTIWVWDSGTSAWKDTDTKGQVTSVNNQTGAVTLTASDVGGATAAQGAKADTAVQPGDLATVATTGAYSDLTGTPTIPAAQVNSDWNASSGVAEILNKPTIPTVGDGTITITQGGVTKGTFTTNQSGNTTIDVDAGGSSLPSQTGNSGKFLTTDGTDASWATVDALPSQTGYSGRVLGTDGFVAGWVEPEIVQRSTMPVASQDEEGNIYQFVGTTDANYTHGYFYECVSDGGNPATYSWTQTDVQPQAGGLPSQSGNSGKFLTTDGTDASWATVGTLPTQTGNYGRILTTNGITASWDTKTYITNMDVILGGSYQANRNYQISIGYSTYCQGYSIAIGVSAYTKSGNSIAIGESAHVESDSGGSVKIGYGSVTGLQAVSVGGHANVTQRNGTAIGSYAVVKGAYGTQLGYGTNTEAGTFCVGSYYNSANVNYKLMDADGTIPTDRFTTTPSADGTYVPTLTISSGTPTRSWAAGLPAIPTTAGTYTLQVVVDANGDPTLSWV